MELLAIFGRGIQKSDDVSLWGVTEDFEVLADDGAHHVIRKPVDDSNPNCVIGGGELNLLAGVELKKRYSPPYIVCAYAHRALYLKKADSPSESQVMSREFLRKCKERGLPKPNLVVWPTKDDRDGVSNLRTEVINILEFALQHSCSVIGMVSVFVKLPRIAVFVDEELQKLDAKKKLVVRLFASELVLLEADSRAYAERVLNVLSSDAFRRNVAREKKGTSDLLAGGNWGYEAWRPFYALANAGPKK